MSIKAGLVGLPNVGKSTLFNALTKSSVPAENYPFCTIEPHTAVTAVPDKRLDMLEALYSSAKKIHATVSFVDIAGLVKGAASGEGLGNQFLSHIKEVDLVLHVLRCFEDPNIMHHGETIDPLDDYHTIVSELMLKDLESIEKRLEKLPKLIRAIQQGPEKKMVEAELVSLTEIKKAIDEGNATLIRELVDRTSVPLIPLLSPKDFLIIANIGEKELDIYHKSPHYHALIKEFGADRVLPICAKIEQELSQLDEHEARELMGLLGLAEPGLNTIVKKTYERLGLITFFTCGPKEAHAWPLRRGSTIRQAAGEIHSDLERGFICAEVFNCTDLFKLGSEQKLKDAGLIRKEGHDYLVRDGDIILIHFNV